MNISQGYKQTELGIIPEDWEVVTVDDVLDMPTKTTSTSSFFSKYYVGTENMYSFKRGIAPYRGYLPYMLVREYKPNDILTSNIRPYLKKIWLANRYGGCSSDVIVFRVKDAKTYSAAYIYTILSDDAFFKYSMDSAIGTKMPRGDKSAIKVYTFAIPKDIAEQRAIAEALSDVDDLITALDKKIAKKRLLKQGAMQQLLTGKKRLPGFTDEWEEITFGEYVDIYRGGSPRPIENYITDNPNGVNWIKIGDVKPNEKYINKTEECIIPDGVSRSRRVYVGDFILSNSMSFGRPYILGIDGCIHDGWLVIQNYHNTFDKDYLYYLLCSEYVMMQYIGMAAGSSVKNLNKEKVASLQLCVPTTIKEQQAIATILSDMDKEIAYLEAQRDKYRLLKSGMMQKLLTGQIRLKTE